MVGKEGREGSFCAGTPCAEAVGWGGGVACWVWRRERRPEEGSGGDARCAAALAVPSRGERVRRGQASSPEPVGEARGGAAASPVGVFGGAPIRLGFV